MLQVYLTLGGTEFIISSNLPFSSPTAYIYAPSLRIQFDNDENLFLGSHSETVELSNLCR